MFRVKNDNCVTWDRMSSCVTRETSGVLCYTRNERRVVVRGNL